MSDDIRQGILDTIKAYERLRADPPKPGPLLIPEWFPEAWANTHPDDDLDGVCRVYGFDGYLTPSGRRS